MQDAIPVKSLLYDLYTAGMTPKVYREVYREEICLKRAM